jgi:NADH-ubiquinone oxidoreductase chain 5
MCVPLFLLSFGAIFVGYLGRDAIIGGGSDFFQQSIFVLPSHNNVLDGEFMDTFTK